MILIVPLYYTNLKKTKMKRMILILAIMAVAVGCKSTSPVSTKSDSRAEESMRGTWTLTSVTYPGSDFIQVNAFHVADSKCFEGSTWKLVANNNSGSVAITKPGCTPFSSELTWYVNKGNEFVLKLHNTSIKAKKVRDGYVLRLANKSDNSFQLIDQIDIGGKMNEIVYQFQRN
jgi:hypothetical protein